jgi:anti-sigma factor RsiW
MGLIDDSPDPGEGPPNDLAVHLQTCEACADYRAATIKTRKLLKAFRTAMSTPDPTELALKRVTSRISSSRRQLFWSLVLTATSFAAPFGSIPAGAPLPLSGVLSLASIGLFSLFLSWRLLRKQSAVTPWGRRTGASYKDWRDELQWEVRGVISGAVFASIFSVGFLFLAAFGSFPLPGSFVVLGVALLMGVGALHAFFFELRALRHELALFGETSGE